MQNVIYVVQVLTCSVTSKKQKDNCTILDAITVKIFKKYLVI